MIGSLALTATLCILMLFHNLTATSISVIPGRGCATRLGLCTDRHPELRRRVKSSEFCMYAVQYSQLSMEIDLKLGGYTLLLFVVIYRVVIYSVLS